MKQIVFLLIFLALFCPPATSQRKIAITIDDVPNVGLYQSMGYRSLLLQRLDSLKVPVAIFVNEANVYRTDSVERNTSLLSEWIGKSYITPGNHSYSHPAYSKVGFSRFSEEVIKGEALTRTMALKQKKHLRYFRFPFNDLGKDSADHEAMGGFLRRNGYRPAPFTLESADWMFTVIYEYYLNQGNLGEAKRVALKYVEHTLALLDYFEQLDDRLYHRPVNQIYLCHDNLLNAHYLPELVSRFKARKYTLVSLDESLRDKVYLSPDYYTGAAGFSWIYRWVQDLNERKRIMQREPDNADIELEYEKVSGR